MARTKPVGRSIALGSVPRGTSPPRSGLSDAAREVAGRAAPSTPTPLADSRRVRCAACEHSRSVTMVRWPAEAKRSTLHLFLNAMRCSKCGARGSSYLAFPPGEGECEPTFELRAPDQRGAA